MAPAVVVAEFRVDNTQGRRSAAFSESPGELGAYYGAAVGRDDRPNRLHCNSERWSIQPISPNRLNEGRHVVPRDRYRMDLALDKNYDRSKSS